MELKQKGEKASIGAFKQLKVSLIWTSPVDLDLMAFFKTKTGQTGGVYSDNYSGGSLGDLNQFPFIALSGDQGVGAVSGNNTEQMIITKLDGLEELYICALNFTDASSGSDKVFADYDARVEVVTDRGDKFDIVLDSTQKGSVAILCKILNGFIGSDIINNSQVMSFQQFSSEIPGANNIKLSSKIVLAQKGDSAIIKDNSFHAKLMWKQAVDLDLHSMYELKKEGAPAKKGILKTILGMGNSLQGHISFMSKGHADRSPWIYLDQDAGVGDRGGNNEENIRFTNIAKINHAIIAVNIFAKSDAVFAQYDGKVTIKAGSQEIEIPLMDKIPGNWCVIAHIDNSGQQAKLININKTLTQQPVLSNFI